jgi:hypothetical protein
MYRYRPTGIPYTQLRARRSSHLRFELSSTPIDAIREAFERSTEKGPR